MKQFSTILKFEFASYLKNKIFVWLTVVLVIIIGIVLSIPRITDMVNKDESNNNVVIDTQNAPIVLISDTFSSNKEITKQVFSAMADKNIQLTDKTADQLRTSVDNEEINSAIIITSPTKYQYIVKNTTMYDNAKYIIDEIMLSKYRIDEMAKLGITPDQSQKVLNATIESELIQTGKNQMNNFFYTYVLIFLLYFAILFYGQFVAMSVAAEKSSRAMELLITSAKPTNLMFGKVLGSGLAGLLQMTVLLGSSFVFYNFNKEYFADNAIIQSIFNMPLEILLYTILFFFLGFFIYAFMYGALGSLASRSEDINTSIMPVMFLFIIAFFIVMFSMGSGNVDSPLMVVCSYIPFTSPMAMFVRIAMGNVAPLEIIASVIVLIISTVIIAYISAGIYKLGVLLYGKPPKLTEVFKMMKQSKKYKV